MPVLLLDTYNVLFRSFASLPRAITADDGQPINAVYGALAFIIRLVRELQPDHIVAAFDVPELPTFRHQRFSGYQAQRGPLGGEHAEDFRRQVEIATLILPALGIPAMASPGFEADDLIGTASRLLLESNMSAIAVSTDRDLLQLVRPGFSIMVPGKEQRVIGDEAGVRERIGVAPEGVTMFKALAGDPSDNIPGLPGIGAKTAASLTNQHGSLGALYQNVDALPPRLSKVLLAGRDNAYLFADIATIRTDVPGVSVLPLPVLGVTPDNRPRELLKSLGHG